LFKDQDKDKDISSKDKDKDKDCIVKDKDQEDKDCILVLKESLRTRTRTITSLVNGDINSCKNWDAGEHSKFSNLLFFRFSVQFLRTRMSSCIYNYARYFILLIIILYDWRCLLRLWIDQSIKSINQSTDSIVFNGVEKLRESQFSLTLTRTELKEMTGKTITENRWTVKEVVLHLITSKCLPVLLRLLYGLEVCPLSKSDLHSLDFVVNRLPMKLFKTSNNDVISECRNYLHFFLPSELLEKCRS